MGVLPKRVFLLYQYFHPDDVVSARLFSDLAIECTREGIDVVAFPAIHSCHTTSKRYPRDEAWIGGRISRVWRPDFRQSSTVGRILNCIFMLIAWSWRALVSPRSEISGRSDCVIIGTDPIFGVLAAIPWRIFRPGSRIVLWCHDLHPEASIAEGTFSERSWLIRILRAVMRLGYRRCDTLIDLGSCMRGKLQHAANPNSESTNQITITPWSLVEPEAVTIGEPRVRHKLFGECSLALLYSGNLGRAHEFEHFLSMAQNTEKSLFHFCFAGRGHGINELQKKLEATKTSNVSIAGFAEESELQARLSACDVHLVSLRPEWTGTVVPSKFFGALAIGRPVLFSGSRESCIAKWIQEHKVGWVVDDCNQSEVIQQLLDYSGNKVLRDETERRCLSVYQQNFSKASQMRHWKKSLQGVSG